VAAKVHQGGHFSSHPAQRHPKPVPAPEELKAIVIWVNEQYMSIATEFQTDMIFLLEEFCGHGFENGNPQAPCYRGPGTPRFFDLTCIHPNPAGHDHITDSRLASRPGRSTTVPP
jgi:hypothetical protein